MAKKPKVRDADIHLAWVPHRVDATSGILSDHPNAEIQELQLRDFVQLINNEEAIDDELMVYIANAVQNFLDGGSFAPKRSGRHRKLSPSDVLRTYRLKQGDDETATRSALIKYLCENEPPSRRWKKLPERERHALETPGPNALPARPAKPGERAEDISRPADDYLEESYVRGVVDAAIEFYPRLKNLK